ncbi:Homeobox protein Hox-D3 [Entomophthora muscae]|uniref:Homeobox protein Hox-D3 n=1 Tax=Entomophthora muscae TaxID=34485 RepID=A0ACC2SHK2_9FUNG|nr:Homeobox protein Hox-D3 [Entomophthora muscae]
MLPDQNNQAAFKGPPSTRSNFTPQQVRILEDCFDQECRPVRAKMEELASATGLTFKNVQIWFQNRRARARKKEESLSSSQRADKPSNIPQGPELAYQPKGYFRTNPSLADSLRPRNYAAQPEPIHGYTPPAPYYRYDPSPCLYPPSISTPRKIYPAPSTSHAQVHSQQAYIHLPHPHTSSSNYERANYNPYTPNRLHIPKASPSVTGHYLESRPPSHMAKFHYPSHSM